MPIIFPFIRSLHSQNSRVLFALLLLLSPVYSRASVVYVDIDHTGPQDGTSWGTAYTSLQNSIDSASPGDEIWIAEGTYYEEITLRSDIGIYGAFVGTESERTDRDRIAHPTVLHGNGELITVVNGSNLKNTVLDGLKVTWAKLEYVNGSASDDVAAVMLDNCESSNSLNDCSFSWNSGLGFLIADSSPIVTNSTFNFNRNRGVVAGMGSRYIGSVPTFIGCTFQGNSEPQFTTHTGDGEAAGLALRNGGEVRNCIIIDNTALSANGGLYFWGDGLIEDCTISGNRSGVSTIYDSGVAAGVRIFNEQGGATIRNCIIEDNHSFHSSGGLSAAGRVDVIDCVVRGNTGVTGGIGVGTPSEDYIPKIINCLVENNVGSNRGGGIGPGGAAQMAGNWLGAIILDSIISNNRSNTEGGGVYLRTDGIVRNCQIIDNSAEYGGGVSMGSRSELSDSVVQGNQSDLDGGGIYIHETLMAQKIIRTKVTGNFSGRDGGGVHIPGRSSQPPVVLDRCRIVGNGAFGQGGGIYLKDDWRSELEGCTVAYNANGGIYLASGQTTVYTLIVEPEQNALHGLISLSSSLRVDVDESPMFREGPMGRWTSTPGYNSTLNYTKFYTTTSDFELGALAGEFMKPDFSKSSQILILDNGQKWITVHGDKRSIAPNGDEDFRIMDYHLAAGSPAIDTGSMDTPMLVESIWYDFDNEPRPMGARVDIGADEYDGGDADGDGLGTYIEELLGTDPEDADTDNDGLSDGDEVNIYNTGPRNPDSDGDGIGDAEEVAIGSDPRDDTSVPIEVWLDFAWFGSELGSFASPCRSVSTAMYLLRDGGDTLINGNSSTRATPWIGRIDKPVTITTTGAPVSIGL